MEEGVCNVLALQSLTSFFYLWSGPLGLTGTLVDIIRKKFSPKEPQVYPSGGYANVPCHENDVAPGNPIEAFQEYSVLRNRMESYFKYLKWSSGITPGCHCYGSSQRRRSFRPNYSHPPKSGFWRGGDLLSHRVLLFPFRRGIPSPAGRCRGQGLVGVEYREHTKQRYEQGKWKWKRDVSNSSKSEAFSTSI